MALGVGKVKANAHRAAASVRRGTARPSDGRIVRTEAEAPGKGRIPRTDAMTGAIIRVIADVPNTAATTTVRTEARSQAADGSWSVTRQPRAATK